MDTYQEPAKELSTRDFDVVVAGGGTAGVVTALASARRGAETALIEAKGYTGGLVVEGGTALHSFYNLWKAFPGVKKRQVVKGIPQEIIDRLKEEGGTSGHAEMDVGYDYDSVCTAIDTEIYKLVTLEMLKEAGVHLFLNTFLCGALSEENSVQGAVVESRSGRELFRAHTFIDTTGYGDLAAYAGAHYEEPNDHPVANSMGVANVNLEEYHKFLEKHNALREYAEGFRSGEEGKIVRLHANMDQLPEAFRTKAREIGMAAVTTSVHDDYFMFIKLNYKMPVSPTDRDEVTKAELKLRRQQKQAIELIREYIPGCKKAFVARSSPSLCIRRGRVINCDYDIPLDVVLEGRHFEDEIMVYGFHDLAPRLQIKDGGTYGIPYRALRVQGFSNLLAAGMNITSDFDAHMSTRNTVCCMGQGQAAGTAAALCARKNLGIRELAYDKLKKALIEDGVYFSDY